MVTIARTTKMYNNSVLRNYINFLFKCYHADPLQTSGTQNACHGNGRCLRKGHKLDFTILTEFLTHYKLHGVLTFMSLTNIH